MRKFVILALAVLLSLFTIKTHAAPTDGTIMPYRGKYITGYQNNAIFKHDLADPYGNVKSDQHYYTLSYGVFDWLSLDGKIGFGNVRERVAYIPRLTIITDLQGDTASGFASWTMPGTRCLWSPDSSIPAHIRPAGT
jgi:hypothetical protein